MKVLLDACVLYPYTTRDVLIQLHVDQLIQVRWTSLIEDEWIRNLLKNNPSLQRANLDVSRARMHEAVPDWETVGSAKTTAALSKTAIGDRHVLSAAIDSECAVLLTFNVKDFDSAEAAAYSVRVVTPDDFLDSLIKARQDRALASFAECRSRFSNPSYSADEYILRFQNLKLAKTADALRRLGDRI